MNFQINGIPVRVSGEFVDLAINSRQFQEWVLTLDPRFRVSSIDFQAVDYRVDDKSRPHVQFIKFQALMTDAHGLSLRHSFMRGGSVVILVVLECEGEEHTLLTRQPRFPAGIYSFPEIPAGTMESDGSFVGGAIRELKEETGIEVTNEKLVDLVEYIHKGKFKGIFATPGGSDEFFRPFALHMKVEREYLASLQGKLTGLAEEGEHIQLEIILLKNLLSVAPDAKSVVAYALYREYQRLKFEMV